MANPIELELEIPQTQAIEVEAREKNVVVHGDLLGRDASNQHPIGAITGLQSALNSKQAVIQDLDEIRSGAAKGATALQPGDVPTVNDGILTIQKNETSVGTFSANSEENKTINIPVPTTASEVGALPDSTKYGASLSLVINSSTYVVTAQLKDQNGSNIGSAQTIDLPLESVVVNGEYDSEEKKIILTLQNGNTVEFSVADLVAGLQSEITSENMLDADLVDDSTSTNKFTTTAEKTTWNAKVSDVTVDSTSVVLNGVAVIPNASGSNYGVTKLSNSLTSTSNTSASTPNAINTFAREIATGAPIFDKTLTYAVGDKVRYGTGYYECITAITTAHAWNASEWQQITIQGQIDEKVSDVTINGTSIVNGTTKVAELPIAAQGGDYGLIKLRSSAYGLGVDSSGYTIINRATTTDVDERTAYYKPITPLNLDYATIISLSDNKNALDTQDSEWTTARQFASRKWLGAMGSNIYGTSTTAAATVQKEVSIPSITELNAGQLIIVTPTATSTVANSTLKLNNFDAYPMLYGGAAITTSTDSYVWIKDVPGWWLFDGSNWLFAGHGTDINTTYSAMSVANIIAGTETSARLMRSDYLKNGICGVVTAYSSGNTITPSDKYLYNSTSNISALTIAAPSSPDERYMSQINMSSGSTATTLTYPSTFKVLEGCDDVQYIAGVRTFVPVANKRYQIFIENDGVNTVIFAKGC